MRVNNHPERVRGIARREQLETVFSAISAGELKKAVRKVNLPSGTKEEMVETLIKHFAPKRRRGNAVRPGALEPDPEDDQEDDEREE